MAATQYRTTRNLAGSYLRCLDDVRALLDDLVIAKGNRWPVTLKITEFTLNRNDGRFYFKMSDSFPLSYDIEEYNIELWPGAIP